MRISEHTKAIVAGVAGVVYVINEGVLDSVWTVEDTTKLAAAVIAVASVWVFPNRVKAVSR
jgi:hypothetical protein